MALAALWWGVLWRAMGVPFLRLRTVGLSAPALGAAAATGVAQGEPPPAGDGAPPQTKHGFGDSPAFLLDAPACLRHAPAMFIHCPRCSGAGRIEAPEWAVQAWEAFDGVTTLDGWICAVDVQRAVGWAHGTVVRRLETLERGGKVESRVRGGRREWRRVVEGSRTPHRALEPRALSQAERRRAQAAGLVPPNADIQGLGKALGLRSADEFDDGLGDAPEESEVEPYHEEHGTGPGGRKR